MGDDDWDYWTESPQRRAWIAETYYGVDIDKECLAPEPDAGHKCWCELPKGHDGPHEHACAEHMIWDDGDEKARGRPLPSEPSSGMAIVHGMARKGAEEAPNASLKDQA